MPDNRFNHVETFANYRQPLFPVRKRSAATGHRHVFSLN